jgi:response regulator NasT
MPDPVAELIDERESSLKIAIIDESPIRPHPGEGLREAGFTGVVHISEMQSLLARFMR